MDDAASQLVQELSAKDWKYDQTTRLLNPKPDVRAHNEVSLEDIKIGRLAALVGNHDGD